MFYLTKLSTAEIIQHPWQKTYVRVRSMGGITPTGKSGSTWTKPCPSAALTTKNPTGTGMSSQYLLYSESGESDDDQ